MIHWARRTHGCRVGGCLIEGMDAVFIENDVIRAGVLAGKGADIFELTFKPKDVDVLWRRPSGIVNPHRGVPSAAASTGAFMDSYAGGWQELFPTLGAPASYYGAPLGEHGEVALLPWDATVACDRPDTCAVAFEVRCRRTPFLLRRTMTLSGPRSTTLAISEEVTNESSETLEFMWGHHPVFGPPFLEPGCSIRLPGGLVQPMKSDGDRFRADGAPTRWPGYTPAPGHVIDLSVLRPPSGAEVDELFVGELPSGDVRLHNPRLGVGVSLRWDAAVFPYLWCWRTLGPDAGYPWYGATYTLGLEPFSSVPPDFESAHREGTTLSLAPGASMRTSIDATLSGTDDRDRT